MIEIDGLKKDTNFNLVPNYSFEKYSLCPDKYTIIPKSYFVDDWIMATIGTPDYFNSCSRGAGVPYNWTGKLYPKTGNGYVGLIPGMFVNNEGEIECKKEYIEVKLKTTLNKGHYYYLGFSVALAELSRYAMNGIGLYLSDTLINIKNYLGNLNFTPQLIAEGNHILNNYYWQDIDGIYQAKGNENFIIIGNYQNNLQDQSCEVIKSNLLNCSYYLFDDIYVIPLNNYETEDTSKFISKKKITKTISVYFNFGEHRLNKLACKTLDDFIKLYIENGNKLFVYGYTDRIGTNQFNNKLSELRANEVSKYLIKNNFKSKNIFSEGRGKLNGFIYNKLKRKVEIRILLN